jgi:hypothetical protein
MDQQNLILYFYNCNHSEIFVFYKLSKIMATMANTLNSNLHLLDLIMSNSKNNYFVNKQNNVGIEHNRNYLERSKYLVGLIK